MPVILLALLGACRAASKPEVFGVADLPREDLPASDKPLPSEPVAGADDAQLPQEGGLGLDPESEDYSDSHDSADAPSPGPPGSVDPEDALGENFDVDAELTAGDGGDPSGADVSNGPGGQGPFRLSR